MSAAEYKSLSELSLNITEEEYRALPSLSQSALSQYASKGPQAIKDALEGKKFEGTFLSKGSLLDTLVFFGNEEVMRKFSFADDKIIPSPSVKKVVDRIFEIGGNYADTLDKIDSFVIYNVAQLEGFQPNWKQETIVKNIRENGRNYYSLLKESKDKVILTKEDYRNAVESYNVLKTNEFTKHLFQEYKEVEILKQLKFDVKNTKMMADWIVVDHYNKTVQIVDLKTTGKSATEFGKSFMQFKYYIQAVLYTTIVKRIMSGDEYFRHFKMLPFQFVVINVEERLPIIYQFNENSCIWDFAISTGECVKGVNTLITEYNWFLETKKFDYPYEVYRNNGVVELNELRKW